MALVDDRGRVFGRFNLIDAAVVAFLLGLVPLGYGAYLLFKPVRPRIDSVTQSEITREERRVTSGGFLTAKLKVRGTGFNPLLRAFIDDNQALGFVFETPNSADVLVGAVAPGTHDLVLFDGVQEVARARGAVTITDPARPTLRVVGWFTNLTAGVADQLKAGFSAPADSPVFEVLAVGNPRPASARITVGQDQVDLPLADRLEREAVVFVRCDPSPDNSTCSIGGRLVADPPPVVVSFEGLRFEIADVLPAAPPVRARAVVRTSSAGGLVKAGDRDRFLDERAAVVAAAGANTISLDLGVDPSREGWRYRGRLVTPGAPFSLTTDRYRAEGEVVSLEVKP